MEHPEAAAKMERDMKSICDGIKSKMEVVNDTCRLYKDVYEGCAQFGCISFYHGASLWK